MNCKLIFVGAPSTGKTSVIRRFIHGDFQPTFTTISVAFDKQTVEREGKTIQLQLWDTAGQEKFDAITPTYYRSADAVAIMCSLDQIDSLQKAHYWLSQIQQNADSGVKTYLVLNKVDLEPEFAVLTAAQVEAFANANNLPLFKTSAKTGKNVRELVFGVLDDFLQNNNVEDDEALVSVKRKDESRGCCV